MSPEASRAKPSWPLLLLAMLSFIPGFGFFIGSVAVTWGLLSERPRARLAIGIAATGALLQILVLSFFFLSAKQGSPLFAGVLSEVARQDLVTVVQALEAYHQRKSVYPASLLDLQREFGLSRPVNIYDQSGGVSLRPAPYHYRLAPDGKSYELFGVGPDRLPDTPDDITPLLSDSLRRHSGLRSPQPANAPVESLP
jgi:hypothetical protein